MMTRQEEDLNELSALVLNIIRSPSDGSRAIRHQQITPAGFASFLLGISLSLMLCGSLTFFIGFVLMPWVIGLLICLYFVGLLSMMGRAFLSWNSAPTRTSIDDRKIRSHNHDSKRWCLIGEVVRRSHHIIRPKIK